MTRRIAETYAAGGVVVVGMGADGWSSLDENARHALRQAATIIGSPRQLDQLPVWLGARRQDWRSPHRADIRSLIEEHASSGVAVLASGDPLVYGIGRTLVEELGIERLHFLPNLSSVALACARLGWPAETITVLNAPGGGLDALPGQLRDGARLIVLSAGRDTPATVAVRLADQGYGASDLVVLGDLGSAREERWEGTASGWDAEVTSGLNVIAVACRRGPTARGEPTADVSGEASGGESGEKPGGESAEGAPHPAAEDASTASDGVVVAPAPAERGQRASTYGLARLAEIGPLLPGLPGPDPRGRATAADVLASLGLLAALDPAPGEQLWVAGEAEAAAVAWCLAAPGARAAIIGREPQETDRSTPFGIPPIRRVAGPLPLAAAGLGTPDAVLLAGSGAAPRTVEAAWRALRQGGRLVAAATTLDGAAVLARYHRAMGGDLTRIQLADGRAGEESTVFAAGPELVVWVRRKVSRP